MKKTILMIIDGWGKGSKSKSDIISKAKTPNYDYFLSKYPNSALSASGEDVGLPEGQMGNSEVGHLNIGSGRIVYQDLVKINKAIENGSFYENKSICEAFDYANKYNKAVHFIGLVSNGGVHSMDKHLYALCKLAEKKKLSKGFIHALTDGRDTDPKSGYESIKKLIKNIRNSNIKLATLTGRYYTMDRDKRWERVKVGYDLMLNGIGEKSNDILKSIEKSYKNNITDEFIKPIVMVDNNKNPIAKILENDVVICFNFRTDRLRQITTALTQKNMPEHNMTTIPLRYYTMTRYDESFKGINVIYDKENIKNTIGEVIANNNLKQLRIAETEKYAHVTFFFSGGREEAFKNEERVLIPSPKVATYDLKPEMSAIEVKDELIKRINRNYYDFICVNFANCDMVGHTGVYNAIKKAVETVDFCMGEIVKSALKKKYQIMIISDHGNADFALNNDGTPNTAHSLNSVPCIIIGTDFEKVENGILADIAPSLLKMMKIKIPDDMTGKIIVG